MTDAPKRIWAAPSRADGWYAPYAGQIECEDATEYVRADLAPSPDVVRGLVEALRVSALALAEHEPYPMSACGQVIAALAAYEKETRHD